MGSSLAEGTVAAFKFTERRRVPLAAHATFPQLVSSLLTDFAILRAQSIKRSANGVSVRSLRVINPTAVGGDKTSIGKTLMFRLPPKRITDAGRSVSQRPVSSNRR